MKKPASRGRPRKYDPDTALHKALTLFWKKGYAATSLDNLAEATGMNRPSLYAAFGNKKSIYLKSLEKFQKDLAQKVLPLFSNDDHISHSLKRYFEILIDIYTGASDQQYGCMTICTATTEAPNDEEIKHQLNLALKLIDNSFEQQLKRAQERGELPADADLTSLARLFSSVMHSLSIRARAGVPRSQLEQMVDHAIKDILR